MLSPTPFAGQAFPLSAARWGLPIFGCIPRHFRAALCIAFLLLLTSSLPASAQRGVDISYLTDPSEALTIEQAASPEHEARYRGYVPSFMAFSQLPDDFNGAVWFKIVFDSSFEKPVNALHVDLGTFLPGLTQLFIPRPDKTFVVMESRPPQGAFTLPENVPFPDVLYARVDGTPGLWFRPFLGSQDDSPRNFPLHIALAGLFGLAMLVLLVQYIRKAEEWRLWAAITAGCGIVSAILPSSPAAGAAHTPLMAVGMLMPGLILLFFVHTARHLFDSPRTMPGYDKILVLLYLISGGIALLPLAPGFLWTARYLPFAGIALLPLLPVAMMAMCRSLRCCFAFFCAILLPIAGVAASAWELTATTVPILSGSGGLWGFGLGLLILSLSSPCKTKTETAPEEDVFDSLNRIQGLALHKDHATPPAFAHNPDDPAISPEATGHALTPEDDAAYPPDLQQETETMVPPQDRNFPNIDLFGGDAGSGETPLPVTESAQPLAETIDIGTDNSFTPDTAAIVLQAVKAAKPETADTVPSVIAQSAASAAQTEEPVAAPVAPSVLSLREDAASALDTTPRSLTATSETESATRGGNDVPFTAVERRRGRRILFDLPLLIKTVYDTLAPLAEKKNLGLTWFIAPQTGHLFEGEADMLESALNLLLRDMVESVDQGNVRLNVRRLPDSVQPGHLAFTVVEWDAKQTEHGRNITGLAEAWALAEKTGGIFSIEHSPGNGTTVIFSSIFTAVDKTKESEAVAGATPEPLPVPGAAEKVPPTWKIKTLSVDRGPFSEVQVFADQPDNTMPNVLDDDLSVSAAQPLVPPGIDADGLTEQDEPRRDPYRLIVADIAASSRAKTAAVLNRAPYTVLECASPSDAYNLYLRHPSALLVMNADMPEVDIAAAIRNIHADDAAHKRSPAFCVALVGYPAQADRLIRAGCSRTVQKTLLKEELPAVVLELVPPPPAGQPSSEERTALEPASSLPPEELIDKALTSLPPAAQTPETDVPNTYKPASLPKPIVESGIFASVLPPREPAPVVTDSGISCGKPDAHSSAERSGSGLSLIDMIVTDEDVADEALPMTSEAVSTKGQTTAVPASPATAAQNAPASNATPRAPTIRVSVGKPKINTTGKTKPVKATSPQTREVTSPNHAPGMVRPGQTFSPTFQPGGQNQTKQTESPPLSSGNLKTIHDGADFHTVEHFGTVDTPAPVPHPEKPADGNVSEHLASVPLPGEDDCVFKDKVPLIPGLIAALTDAMDDAARGRAEKSPLLVQEAAERVAGKAESFGLARLERMARCVERAAAADDIEPMECVLDDLETWIARYKEALQKLHRESL